MILKVHLHGAVSYDLGDEMTSSSASRGCSPSLAATMVHSRRPVARVAAQPETAYVIVSSTSSFSASAISCRRSVPTPE